MNLFEVAEEIARRLSGTFLRGADGRRPVYGGTAKFQDDPHWRDLVLFYEYFHGDNGAGLGASHQTGWTGLIAVFLDLFGRLDAKALLETERDLVALPDRDGAGQRRPRAGLRAGPRLLGQVGASTWTPAGAVSARPSAPAPARPVGVRSRR